MPPVTPAGIHMPGPVVRADPRRGRRVLPGLRHGRPAASGCGSASRSSSITLLYWGREAMRDYDRTVPAAGAAGHVPRAPCPPRPARRPEGVHIPPPSFRPLLVSIGCHLLVAAWSSAAGLLVFGFLAHGDHRPRLALGLAPRVRRRSRRRTARGTSTWAAHPPGRRRRSRCWRSSSGSPSWSAPGSCGGLRDGTAAASGGPRASGAPGASAAPGGGTTASEAPRRLPRRDVVAGRREHHLARDVAHRPGRQRRSRSRSTTVTRRPARRGDQGRRRAPRCSRASWSRVRRLWSTMCRPFPPGSTPSSARCIPT